jgi:hypothetical protein
MNEVRKSIQDLVDKFSNVDESRNVENKKVNKSNFKNTEECNTNKVTQAEKKNIRD